MPHTARSLLLQSAVSTYLQALQDHSPARLPSAGVTQAATQALDIAGARGVEAEVQAIILQEQEPRHVTSVVVYLFDSTVPYLFVPSMQLKQLAHAS